MFRSSCTRFLKDNDVIQALENHWITGKCSTCFSICCYCSVFAIAALLKSEANGVARWIKTMIISSVMFSNTTGWNTPQHCFTEVRRCPLALLVFWPLCILMMILIKNSNLLFSSFLKTIQQIHLWWISWNAAAVSNSLKTKSNEWEVAQNFCTIMYKVIVSENQGKQKG